MHVCPRFQEVTISAFSGAPRKGVIDVAGAQAASPGGAPETTDALFGGGPAMHWQHCAISHCSRRSPTDGRRPLSR